MRLRIAGRLYALVGLFALGCALLTAALIYLQSQRQMDARVRGLEALVESATGVFEAHRKLAEGGAMKEDEALKRAPGIVEGMRYGSNEYFVVYRNDPEFMMLMSGGSERLHGSVKLLATIQFRNNLRDPSGARLGLLRCMKAIVD